MYLIKNLKHIMKYFSLTQQELGDRINVKRPLVGSWLQLRSEPQIHHLKSLSNLFKVSIDYLCMEDLSKISKEERLSNYNLIQKRLQK